jgi:hypothetical protein
VGTLPNAGGNALPRCLDGDAEFRELGRPVTVYDIKDAEGRVVAFEVDNSWIGRRGLCRLVTKIPQSRLVRRPRVLSWFREDAFCEFEIDGVIFEASEPFGDNDRYWIGPRPTRWAPPILAVRQAFLDKRPISPWVRTAMVVLFVALVFAILWGARKSGHLWGWPTRCCSRTDASVASLPLAFAAERQYL